MFVIQMSPMTPEYLLLLILGIVIVSQSFDWILSFLNMRSHTREVPATLAGEVDPEKYAKSYDYHRANFRFGLLQSIISFVVIIGFLGLGGPGWLDEYLREVTTHPVWLALLFFGVLYFVSDLLSIPFAWYKTFVIEELFGFNKMTPTIFWLDKLKGYLLAIVLGGGIMAFLVWLVGELGPSFWWWFWLFLAIVMVIMNLFYTSWLLPLFNKLTPMEEGSLRSAIEDYARKVSFPLTHIFVIDGSKRSSKANAFFSGMGRRKKVVLYDTLIEQQGEEELVAVLAHEIGHYKKHHIYQGLVLSLLQTGLMLFILSRVLFSPELSLALGAEESSIHLNLIAFGLLYSPISTVLGILMNLFSRKNEFEADRYAAETYDSRPLQQALLKLHTETLSNATPHPLHVFVNYSHPPLIQRLKALKAVGQRS